jgi:hypothetical protein
VAQLVLSRPLWEIHSDQLTSGRNPHAPHDGRPVRGHVLREHLRSAHLVEERRQLHRATRFRPNGATLPQDTSGSLYYHLDDFQNVLDLLRNEKPMYWLFSGSGGGFENGVKTTPEAVGEGESTP